MISEKMRIDRIVRITAGGFHCWVETPVGLIRKPNHAVPQELWDIFEGRKEAPNPIDIIRNQQIDNEKLSIKPPFISSKVAEITHPMVYSPFPEVKWYKNLWLKIKKIFWKIFGMKH